MAMPQMRPADRITTHNGRVPAVASGARCFCIIVRVPTAAGRRTLQGGPGSRKTNPLHLARVFLRSGMTFAYVWVLMSACLCLRAYVWVLMSGCLCLGAYVCVPMSGMLTSRTLHVSDT